MQVKPSRYRAARGAAAAAVAVIALSSASPVPDGQGGIWLLVSAKGKPLAAHRTAAGKWSTSAFASGSSLTGLSRIPGGTSLLGAGDVTAGTGADAVVWGYGPGA